MFCSNCGAKNNDGAKFCFSCGNPLQAPTPVEKVETPVPAPVEPVAPVFDSDDEKTMVFMPNKSVETDIDATTAFTPVAPVEPTPAYAPVAPVGPTPAYAPVEPVAPAPAPQPPKKKKNNSIIIIAVVAVILALAVTVGILIGTGVIDFESKETTTEETKKEKETESTTEKEKEEVEYKHQKVTVDGKERVIALDENGNPIIDSDGFVKCYSVDLDGQIVLDEDGKPMEYLVGFLYFNLNDTIYNPVYSMKGMSGWSFNNYEFEKDNTDGKCVITVSQVVEKGYENATLEEWLAHNKELEEEFKKELEKNGYTVEVSEEKVILTEKNIDMVLCKAVIYNSDGSIANYSETLYFQLGDNKKYAIQYKCTEGVGYDESFDFVAFVDNNFTLIGN